MAELKPEYIRFPGLAARKDILDTLNSLSWFLMDACWMMGIYSLAFGLAPLVWITALALFLVDRRPSISAINAGIMAWVCMNITWMVSDLGNKHFWLLVSKIFFVLGVLAIALAVILSDNLRHTFSHFRRFRLKDWA